MKVFFQPKAHILVHMRIAPMQASAHATASTQGEGQGSLDCSTIATVNLDVQMREMWILDITYQLRALHYSRDPRVCAQTSYGEDGQHESKDGPLGAACHCGENVCAILIPRDLHI